MVNVFDKIPETFLATEAESGVLGAVILKKDIVESVADLITGDDFYDETLGTFFEMLLNLHAAGKPVDDATVILSQVRKQKLFDNPTAEIGRLFESCANPVYGVVYAKQIREASNRRKLARHAQEMYRRIAQAEVPATDTSEWMQRQCRTISAALDVDRVRHIGLAAESALGKIRIAAENKYEVGVSTGIPTLDDQTGGLFPNDLTILAARPSIGKTALATQIAKYAGHKRRVALLSSLEMSDEDISLRLMAADTGIEVRTIRAGVLDDRQMAALEEAKNSLLVPDLHVANNRKCKVGAICAAARMQKSTTGLSLLVVDYLNRIQGDHYRDTRADQITQITNDLKDLAGELVIPVLALCQINRDAEGKKPTLANLKDSGGIEENADNVWLLHREKRDSVDADLIIGKARNGGIGELRLTFDPGATMFTDYQPSYDEFN